MKKSVAIMLLISFALLTADCKETANKEQPILLDNEEEITIASWNLKNFGQTKLNNPLRIDVIVSILKKYDIIAIQEVQDVSLALPNELIAKINADGENYKVVASDRVGRGNRKEQYLFVYDDDVIDFIAETTGFGIEPDDEFAREPFYAMFRAGNFDFYLMTIHTDPDDVAVEIPALKVAYEDLQNNTTDEDDIILLGDLNAKAPGVTTGSYITMDSIALIPNIVFTIKEETNTRGGKSYDNIIFQGNYTAEYSDSCGVYAFWTDYELTEDDGFQISDHRLVWAKFRIDLEDDDPIENSPDEPFTHLAALATLNTAKPISEDKNKTSTPFEWWQWFIIGGAGLFGGFLYGIRDKKFILPHRNSRSRHSFNPGFLVDIFFGVAGGFVIFMIVPGYFNFSAGGFDTVKILAVTLVGGYGGRALVEKVFAEQIGKIESNVQKLQDQNAYDANAMALLNKQLDLDPDIPTIPDKEIKEAILASSSSVRVMIFTMARQFRRTAMKTAKQNLLARLIPVLEALIECDIDNKFHRNHGQLGYVLKDKENPDWKRAEEELNKAIKIRERRKVMGFLLYEFNRALCKIHQNATLNEIKKDLDKALLNPTLADIIRSPHKVIDTDFIKWMRKNIHQLKDWIKTNNIKLPSN